MVESALEDLVSFFTEPESEHSFDWVSLEESLEESTAALSASFLPLLFFLRLDARLLKLTVDSSARLLLNRSIGLVVARISSGPNLIRFLVSIDRPLLLKSMPAELQCVVLEIGRGLSVGPPVS